MTWTEILCILLVPTGFGLFAIGYFQRNGKVPKNSIFGTKTRATTASDLAWTAGNLAASPYSYMQGTLCIVGGLIGFVLYSPDSPFAMFTIGAVVILILVIAGFQVARATSAAEHADGKNTP